MNLTMNSVYLRRKVGRELPHSFMPVEHRRELDHDNIRTLKKFITDTENIRRTVFQTKHFLAMNIPAGWVKKNNSLMIGICDLIKTFYSKLMKILYSIPADRLHIL